MILRNIKKTKENLKKEFKENSFKINELNKKIKIINANTFEGRITISFCLANIPFLLSIFSNNFLSPMELYNINLIAMTIGVTSEFIVHKIGKFKEKLKSFSNSNTEELKFEEKITYEIEKVNIKNKNKIVNMAIKKLAKMEQNIEELQNNYVIEEKNNQLQDIENLSQNYLDSQEKNNELSTEYALKEIMMRELYSFGNVISNIFWGIILGLIYFSIPCCFGLSVEDLRQFISDKYFYTPGIIGGLLGIFYSFKRKHNYKMAINNIIKKQQVSMNVLTIEKPKIMEDLESNLEISITNTAEVRLELERQKRKLENMKQNNYPSFPNEIIGQSEETGMSRNLQKKE